MRLSSLAAPAGLLLALAAIFQQPVARVISRLDPGDIKSRLASVSTTAQAVFDREIRAEKTAQEGMNCLAGSGPCPHGASDPLK